jgi:hypothetical protein
MPEYADAAEKKTGFDVDICGMEEQGRGDSMGLELNEDDG